MKKLILFVAFLSILGCEHPETSAYSRNHSVEVWNSLENTEDNDAGNGYKVIGIKDGDTFVLLIDGKEQVVRFAHIDCPEKKQPFGSKAKQFVSEACFGKFVTLKQTGKLDRYKRLIAEVILADGTNLNKELIRNGLAWHFKKYSKDEDYAILELEARSNKIGLWSEPNPIAPWKWRK